MYDLRNRSFDIAYKNTPCIYDMENSYTWSELEANVNKYVNRLKPIKNSYVYCLFNKSYEYI